MSIDLLFYITPLSNRGAAIHSLSQATETAAAPATPSQSFNSSSVRDKLLFPCRRCGQDRLFGGHCLITTICNIVIVFSFLRFAVILFINPPSALPSSTSSSPSSSSLKLEHQIHFLTGVPSPTISSKPFVWLRSRLSHLHRTNIPSPASSSPETVSPTNSVNLARSSYLSWPRRFS